MTTTISAEKVGDQLPNGRHILGDRWTSAIVGDSLCFISLNGINQPSFRAFHETPLLGGVVTAFDIRQRQWNKEIIYEALSSEENLEGRVFGFRHTLLLLTYRKHGAFLYQHLYYWDESLDGWRPNSLYIDPKTELADVRETDLILTAESDDYVYLVTHDRSRGSLVVSQLDTVGGYGKPGPARIDFLFETQNPALKGDTASVCDVCVFDHHLWILFFAHEDPAGSAVRLFSTRLKDGCMEEVDLGAMGDCGSTVLTKPYSGNEEHSATNGGNSKWQCRFCHRQCSKKPTFAQGLCGSQWLFITTSDDGIDRELWSIDLREGRWRLLAAADRYRSSSKRAWANSDKRVSVPSDVEIAAWNDADMEFFGISFENGIYVIDAKRVVDDP